MKRSSKKMTEQQKADILALYLERVDNGHAFELPKGLDDPELLELVSLARDMKIAQQTAAPSEALLLAFDPEKKKRKKSWKFFIPISTVGVTVLVIGVFISKNFNNSVPIVLESQDIQKEVDEVDALFTELDGTISEYDAVIEEMEALLDEDAFTAMDLALAESQL